jgi:hypothetical protein
MSKASDFCKTCAETLGFKGRFSLLAFGVLGLFFPGLVTYLLLSVIAKSLENVDILQQMLKELEDDA